MKAGEQIALEITDIAYGGAGLGRHEGRVVFVPFSIPGETLTVRVTRLTRQWAEAEMVHPPPASPDRVEPPCPFFRRCGGCAYQHIAYPRQLAIKRRQVAETLRRIGKFPEPPVEPTRPSPEPWHYRNRITVQVRPPVVGFHARHSAQIIAVDHCLLAEATVNEKLRHLAARRHLRPGPATLRTGPADGGFRQVNDAAAPILAAEVAALAGTGETLIDAYCGAGFFAKSLRPAFTRLIGIEWDERAIASARRDAGPSEEYRAGDTAALLPEALGAHPSATVLLDPPAQGLSAEVIETLLAALPPRIVYVSCDPATLARDLRLLGGPYRLQRVIPVDMFPQTASIETACLLELPQA